MMIARFFFALLVLLPGLALAQTSPRERLDAARATLERIEGLLEAGLNDGELQSVRAEIEPVRASLAEIAVEVAPLRDAARARLTRLGDEPKTGELAEAAEIGHIRAREKSVFGALDSVAREAEIQSIRADQVINRITEQRRNGFARTLTQHAASILDPSFWYRAVLELVAPITTLVAIVQTGTEVFLDRISIGTLILGLAAFGIGLYIARFARLRIGETREKLLVTHRLPRRLAGALDGLLHLAQAILGLPFAAFLVVAILDGLDLTTITFTTMLTSGFVVPVLFGAMFSGMATAILAPERQKLRLLDLSDWAVGRIHAKARLAALVIAIGISAEAIARIVVASVDVSTAITMIPALLIAIIAIATLMRLRNPPSTTDDSDVDAAPNRLDILRPMLWVVAITILIALIAGYVTLAGFVAAYALVGLFVAAFAAILVALVDSGLTDGLAADGARSRTLANAIGVTPKNVAFSATLLSGFLRFGILAVAGVVLAGPLGFYTEDILSAVERAYFGFKIGAITISPSGILIAIAMFLGIILVTRLIRGWMHNTLLPRTTLDAGLRNSISTVIGYAGAVLAILVALSQIGLDLQNFAIVAGALSVGIGFGLQSIVSNFVSGLILLAERPVRVGDIITVKGGEEGYVRRISVRATEIETYDRATLIIPNSELITGVVKNWVYGNTWARVKVAIKVAYDQDVELIRRTMMAAAKDDPRILPSPPPRVFLANLGDAMEFELIAVVASVETSLAVKSDLHMRIMSGFREAGLRLAAQPAPAGPTIVRIEREPKSNPV